jgi:hypothetical protein
VQIVSASKKQITLQWSENTEEFVTGYRVYRQDPTSNQNTLVGDNVKTASFTDAKPLNVNARYTVVALNGDQESIPSDIIDSGVIVTHSLPGKIEGEAFYQTDGASVYYSSMEPEEDKIISAMGTESASYMLQANKDGKYLMNARVFDSGTPQKFELWLGDHLVATPELKGERGWTTIENIPLTMLKGKHSLSVKGHEPMFTVNWFEISPASE